jgi:hypothetical protein
VQRENVDTREEPIGSAAQVEEVLSIEDQADRQSQLASRYSCSEMVVAQVVDFGEPSTPSKFQACRQHYVSRFGLPVGLRIGQHHDMSLTLNKGHDPEQQTSFT